MIDYQRHRRFLVKTESGNWTSSDTAHLIQNAEELLDKAEKWDKQADEIKDGPSEREKKELNELVGQLNRLFKSAAPGTAFVLSLEYCKKLQEIWK